MHSDIAASHDITGELKQVTVELDSFRVREWPEDDDEIEEQRGHFSGLEWDDEDEVFVEYGGGAHATLRFDVTHDADDVEIDTVATLSSIEPKDGDQLSKRHIRLLPPAERLVQSLEEVDACPHSIDMLEDGYYEADDVVFEGLDT